MKPVARFAVRLLALCAVLGLGLFTVSTAQAAGTPNLALSANASSPLYGETGSVSVTASLPGGEPKGYNLSFRVVLPAGISYAGGAQYAPQVINNAPSTGKTTLIFSNISDLVANSSQSVGFNVAHDPALYEVGDTYDIQYEAFVNTDPRILPAFNGNGTGVPASYTGSAGASTTSKINAIKITKSEPSREGEILRGVHNNQTIYTLKLRNNSINPTLLTSIDDYLPAGLEYLGCEGDPDNTTDAPTNPGSADEYPGSGPIVVKPVTNCHAAQLVETVQIDPDGPSGPLADGVYTHVRWSTGDLTPGQEITYSYRAAVPLTNNTLSWSGTEPDKFSGAQAANLDNNAATPSNEIQDEQKLTNYAEGAGAYQPTAGGSVNVTDDDSITRTAEDLVVYKTNLTSDTLAQGATNTWELRFRTGEYRYSEGIEVTDTLPSGFCPLGPVNYTTGNDPSDSECDSTGANPSVPYKSVTENADGTFTIKWDPSVMAKLAHTTTDDEFVITFPTKTRNKYQQNFLPTTPILARDGISNKVDLTGNAFSRCTAPGTPDCSALGPKIWSDGQQPEPVVDASAAGQSAPSVVLKKEVAASGTDCQAATYVTTIPKYHPGDTVCWRLSIDFPSMVDTKELRVTDFLPRNSKYVPGSYQDTASNTTNNTIDTSISTDGVLNWDIAGSYVPVGMQKFQVVFKTTIEPTGVLSPVDIEGNLMKFAIENTPGTTFPLRDQVDFETDAPTLTLKKGVSKIDSTSYSPPADGLTVRGGNDVTYQVDVKSTGDTKDVEVWDQLPAAYTCGMVSSISDGGTCVGGRIKWPAIAAINDGATKSLTYHVLIPGTFGPENTYTNTAGVRQYEGDTNTGGRYVYTPQNNIDPANPRTPNISRVDDSSNVKTPNVAVVKSRTTSIGETSNDINTQATIGEFIDYTIDTTLPSGTTFGTNAKITDTPNAAGTQPIVGTPTATLNGGPLPVGFSISTVGQTITVNIPDNYVVPIGTNSVIRILARTQVIDVAANVRGQNRTNQANVTWKDNTVRSRNSNSVSTTIVEPLISQTKVNSVGSGTTVPGATVTYTLTTSNSNASNVSIAHDTVIVDTVPVGITPVDGGGVAIPDGGVVPGTGNGVWNLAARTITAPAVDIAKGGSVVWSYKGKVDSPAVGASQKVNTAEAKTTSIGGTNPDERTANSPTNTGYKANSSSTVKLTGSSITKSVTPAWATIGTPITYSAKLTIPKNLEFFNLTAADVLPDSLDFDGYVSSSCFSGCSVTSPAPTVQTYNPAISGGLTNIGWDLGHVNAGDTDRVIEFTYKAHVRDTHRNGGAPVLNGQTVVNTINSRSNLTSKYTFNPNNLPAAGTYDHVSPNAQTTTPIREPNVSLDKKVKINSGPFVDGPAEAQASDSLTYSIAVKNNGTSPAYDVVVTDKPDDELINVVNVAGAGFATQNWTPGDHNMAWKIPGPIAPGDTVTLTYTASAVSSASLHTGQTAVNTAKAPKYFGIPEAERTNPWTYREYAGNNDSVILKFEFPEITVTKTTGKPGFPDIADAPVEQSFPWRIVIKNNADVATAFDTVVRDTLPPAWTYDAGSTSITGATTAEPGVVTNPAGDQLTWNFNGQTIAPHGSVTINFTATPQLAARANPPVQTNDSEADSKDSSGNPGNADGPYTDEDDAKATLKFPIADLVLTKTAPAMVESNETFDYGITVKNKGPNTATNVVINDPLPAGLTFVSSADCSSAAVCNLGTILSGASKSVTIRVKATYAVAGTTVINTATATQKEWEPTPDDNTDTVETIVKGEANVEIIKTASPLNPRPGDVVTYTLKAKNIGSAIAQDVKITDSLPVGVTFVSADAPCVENAGTVNCAIGSLNPGEEKTYTVKVTVDPWGTANSAEDHLLDVQKVEAQIDLEAGEQKTVSVTCPSGYFASDGSVRIDHIDQGTGDWTAPQVLESYASSLDTWKGVVKNTATGRAQAKIFAVCIRNKTVDGNHSHDLIVSDQISVSDAVLAGKKTATLMCGPGQIAIQPGFQSSKPADLEYSEPEGNGWKFILDVTEPADVTFSIRCMTRQVSVTNGHTHDLKLAHIQHEFTIQPGTVNEAQLTCADGSKGIVADMDLDEGLVSLGNDPRPVTRAFKIYNPTDHPLNARLSLLCLGLRTGGEHLPPKTLINTAMISTVSFESQTGNNTSSATVVAEDTDNYTPVDPTEPVKPTPNNPVATTRLGGGAFFKKNKVTATVTCSGACSGTGKLISLKKVKVRGKKFRKGSVLAAGKYRLNAAGTKKLTLKVKGRKAKLILKKIRKGKIKLSSGTRKNVRIRH